MKHFSALTPLQPITEQWASAVEDGEGGGDEGEKKKLSEGKDDNSEQKECHNSVNEKKSRR